VSLNVLGDLNNAAGALVDVQTGTGGGRTVSADALLNSGEYRSALVSSCYTHFLARNVGDINVMFGALICNGPSFTNNSTIRVNTGAAFSLTGDGSNTGLFALGDDSVLSFAGGTFAAGGQFQLSNSASVQVQAGTAFWVSYPMQFNGGSFIAVGDVVCDPGPGSQVTFNTVMSNQGGAVIVQSGTVYVASYRQPGGTTTVAGAAVFRSRHGGTR
jgi:hypothetical protein